MNSPFRARRVIVTCFPVEKCVKNGQNGCFYGFKRENGPFLVNFRHFSPKSAVFCGRVAVLSDWTAGVDALRRALRTLVIGDNDPPGFNPWGNHATVAARGFLRSYDFLQKLMPIFAPFPIRLRSSDMTSP
ncbi:MAG: hypothetical protein EOM20_21995 [Spartobacteria bacterium]|nr:hypothetical protein [Spartobacteria bacterium]